jgi:hypothetical protein
VTGLAQVGVGGLSKVQVWINPQGKEWPEDDPYFTKAPWQDAKILPPPTIWGGDLPDGKLPADVRFFTKEGKPEHWPMHYTIAHWATLLKDVALGKHDLYCRASSARTVPTPSRKPPLRWRVEGKSLRCWRRTLAPGHLPIGIGLMALVQ